jgi:hypothetical protein
MEDFDAVCERVDALETKYDELNAKITAMKYVVSVTKNETGFLVTPSEGAPLQIDFPITEGPGPGAGPVGGLFIKGGNWWTEADDKETDTGIPVVGPSPKIEDGKWLWPTLNADNEIVWEAGEKVLCSAYAVNNNGVWTLWLPTADGTDLQEIKLPAAGDNAGKIDIIGWVEGYSPKNNLSTNNPGQISTEDAKSLTGNPAGGTAGNTQLWNGAEQNFVVYYNYISTFQEEFNGASWAFDRTGDRNAEYGIDYPAVTEKNDAPFSLSGTRKDYLWWDSAKITAGGTAGIWNFKDKASSYEWHKNANPAQDYGAYDIKAKDVVNIMDSQDKGLVINVHPTSASLENAKFTIEDMKGNVLPIAFKEAKLISGLLTRGTAIDGAYYFLEGSNFPGGSYANREAYSGKFTPNALYSLVTTSGLRSEYTEFTFVPTLIKSIEGQVATVNEEEIQPLRQGVGTSGTEPSFYVKKDVWNEITFDEAKIYMDEVSGTGAHLITHEMEINEDYPTSWPAYWPSHFDPRYPTTNGIKQTTGADVGWEAVTNAVVDHYMLVGTNQADEFITTEWGIEFNENHTQFRITKLPDVLTTATFTMDVWKLGIDGKIYFETIVIHPTREEIETEIPLPDYLVQDWFPAFNNAADAKSSDYISGPLTVDLAPMFDHLATFVDPQSATMKMRWMDRQYGAKTYTITNVSIEGENNNTGRGNLNRFMFPNYTSVDNLTTNDVGGTTGTKGVSQQNADGKKPENLAATYAATGTVAGSESTLVEANQDSAGSMAVIGINEKGEPTTDLFDVRKFVIYPNYAYDNNGTAAGGNAASFKIGKVHTFTMEFFAANGMHMNSIKFSFTPKVPVLSELFVKEKDSYWNADYTELSAYYAVPDAWAPTKFYGTGSAPDWSVASNTGGSYPYGADATVANLADNSTYYNVYNPGGITGMLHRSATPLDGGFNKVGARTPVDKQWIAYTELALQDAATQKFTGANGTEYLASTYVKTTIGGNVNGINNGWDGTGTNPAANAFSASTIVQILNQTNTNTAGPVTPVDGLEKGEPNAYGKVLKMEWKMGDYLNFYGYSSDEKATQKFDMKVLSALDELRLVTIGDGMVEAAGPTGSIAKLTKDQVTMHNYNNNRFDIFKEWVGTPVAGSSTLGSAQYKYRYIQNVYFSRPAGVSVYNIKVESTTRPGEYVTNNNRAEAVPASLTGVGSTADPFVITDGFLPIETANAVSGSKTSIHVTVYDRFGRMVEGDVPFTITIDPAGR